MKSASYNALASSFGRNNDAGPSSSQRVTRSHKTIELADGSKEFPMAVDDSDEDMDDVDISHHSESPINQAGG
jgi:hypothetical protein